MAHGEHPDLGRLVDDSAYTRAAADAMQALSTPSRLRILAHLHAGPLSVGDLADAVGMEVSAVSHQLRLLRHLGLIVGRRDGRQVIYALYDDHVGELLAEMVSHVEHVRLGLSNRLEAGDVPARL